MSKMSYWSECYKSKNDRWTKSRVSPYVIQIEKEVLNCGAKILFPGIGKNPDAVWLSNKKYDVHGVDIADEVLGYYENKSISIDIGDFFVLFGNMVDCKKNLFDYIYEDTFLCSVSRGLWERYVDLCYFSLKDKGKIVGLLFPFSEECKINYTLPFIISKSEFEREFGRKFDIEYFEFDRKDLKKRNMEIGIILSRK